MSAERHKTRAAGAATMFDPIAARNSQYWRGPMAFLRLPAKWRKKGSLDGLELSYGAGATADGVPVSA